MISLQTPISGIYTRYTKFTYSASNVVRDITLAIKDMVCYDK